MLVFFAYYFLILFFGLRVFRLTFSKAMIFSALASLPFLRLMDLLPFALSLLIWNMLSARIMTLGLVIQILIFLAMREFSYPEFMQIQFIKTDLPFHPLGIEFYSLIFLGAYIEKKHKKSSLSNAVMFLPLWFNGPVEEPGFYLKKETSSFQIIIGRFSAGLFKLMVISVYLRMFLGHIHHFALGAWFSLFMYSFYLYFSFSGSMDILISAAGFLGIPVKENFNKPFAALGMRDFWSRWHMSLMEWLRKYIFFPVGFYFRKKGKYGLVLSVLATFLISAIWHRFSICMLIWAIGHAGFILFEHMAGRYHPGSVNKLISFIYVLLVFSFLNIFFSNSDAALAWLQVKMLFQHSVFPGNPVQFLYDVCGSGEWYTGFKAMLAILFLGLGFFLERPLKNSPVFTGFLLLLVLIFGIGATGSYFYMNY